MGRNVTKNLVASDGKELTDATKGLSTPKADSIEIGKQDKAGSGDKMDVQCSSNDAKMASCTREDLLSLCDVRLLKRLVACVIKTMDLVTDMADSPLLHCLPVAVTWKVFYSLIAR